MFQQFCLGVNHELYEQPNKVWLKQVLDLESEALFYFFIYFGQINISESVYTYIHIHIGSYTICITD